MTEDRFLISREQQIDPHEIMALQVASGSTGWGIGNEALWNDCCRQSLCTATARDPDGALVGIGFVVGNFRHAELADVAVDPRVRGHGVGRRLVEELLAFAGEHDIRYLGVVRDPAQPWLQAFYASMGFRDIDFAMSLERCLTRRE